MTQMMDERNARIQRQHLERSAYVYVRQSSPRQVTEHLESQRRQYDLVSWASTAGWPTSTTRDSSTSVATNSRGPLADCATFRRRAAASARVAVVRAQHADVGRTDEARGLTRVGFARAHTHASSHEAPWCSPRFTGGCTPGPYTA